MPNDTLNLYQGWIQHSRQQPRPHNFRYRYFQIWLDVEKTDKLDDLSRFWSSKGRSLVSFKRDNYQPGDKSIHESICQIIKERTDDDFQGKVYLLGNLTYWGYCYNPVCFYFCYDQQGNLKYILSEIHNTPWGERFTYLHNVSGDRSAQEPASDSSRLTNKTSDNLKFKFDKNFHVSPFMPMNLDYEWRFKITDDKIVIGMNLHQDNTAIFNATMNLQSTPLNTKTAWKIAFRYPFMCVRVLIAIYWQALLLWLKGTPFNSHPDNSHPDKKTP